MARAITLMSQGLLYLALTTVGASEFRVTPDIYMAGLHHARWDFLGSRILCELQHEIPGFGFGRFLRMAGEELSFRIESSQRVPARTEAVMREVSPDWAHAGPDPYTLSVAFAPGLRPLQLGRKPAAWLLSSLAKGQIGSFDFLDWNDDRKQVHVRLSPVNYQPAYEKFRRCLQQLPPDGFEAYRATEIHFPLDGHLINEDAKPALQELAAYVNANDAVKRIEIAAHADDQGSRRYNKRLSARRAASVYDYLRQAGVAAELMRRRAYGESRPKLPGRSEAARAANRRTEITLVK